MKNFNTIATEYQNMQDPFTRVKVTTSNNEMSRTKQDQKDAADIHKILERYTRTGQIPQNTLDPMYGDFSQITDFREARNSLIEAENTFFGLPSEIRSKFQNDPAKMIDFLSDEKNRDEAIKLGLVSKPEEIIKPLTAADLAAEIKKKDESPKT